MKERHNLHTISNPILKGFYPDPCILRVGEDYYIATSTFEWFPGVCIQHSRDLEHWETLPAPLRNESVLDLKGIDTSCGIWAPNLTYADGMFYLIYTVVYTDRPRFKDTHNFLTTAKNIEGPWSKPVFLNCSGFDPSLFHDDDGRKWLVNMTIDQRPTRTRFSGIVMQEYNPETQHLVGPVYPIFKGTKTGKTEGPNLCKHDGMYYLLCAEGGTEFGHCCTLARSRTVNGVYEACPYNPIMTSDFSKDCPFQRAGHGMLVETADQQWLMAHLCSRPLDRFSILGRETSVQNIEWTPDGWFRVLHDHGKFPRDHFEFHAPEESRYPTPPEKEDFDLPVLPREFLTLRQSAETCGLSLKERKGFLRIHGGNSLACKYEVGFLARRIQSLSCEIVTCVQFIPQNFCQTAGLVCYYNGDNYFYFKISRDERTGVYLSVESVDNTEVTESKWIPVPEGQEKFCLRARIQGRSLQFAYSFDDSGFVTLKESYDMAVLSDEHVNGNGFTGAMAGICCEDLQNKTCHADFDWFQYRELD
jgi:xylan 1,4-beta-xylosidase